MRKKWIALLLCMVLTAGLTACGSSNADNADKNQAEDSQSTGNTDGNQAGDETGGLDETDGVDENVSADENSNADENAR